MIDVERVGQSRWEAVVDEVELEVGEVCGHVHSLHGRLVRLVERVLVESLWSQPGVRSPEHWLCWQAGISPAVARRVVAAARRRGELPATMAAFEAGELSLDQVSPIVERVPGWADEQVCALAKKCTVSQIRAAVGRYRFDHDADAPPTQGESGPTFDDHSGGERPRSDGDVVTGDQPAEPVDPWASVSVGDPARTWLRWSQLGDGTWQLSARLDVDDGLVVDAALREVRDALFADLGRSATGPETLVELAQRSLGSVDERSRRDRYRVHVTLDETHGLVDPFGFSLPGWLRDLICCDSSMAVTWTRQGRPIAQGSTADSIPAATRRYVLARDQQCRVPGCGARRRLDVHHVIHRSDGGTNDPCNLIAICPAHHRMHHRGRLGIRGDADTPGGLFFTDHRGREIGTNRLIRPPTGPPPRPAGSYRHPIGEPLHTRWITFHQPRHAR